MKRLLPLLLALFLFPVHAGEEGALYDVYIYHGRAHKDYQQGGGRNHGRTEPYTYIGFATEAAIRSGLTILYTGKDPRIVNNAGENCPGDALEPPFDEGVTRLYESTQISVAHHDQLRTAMTNITVNCVQKKDAGLGDNTHAAVGIIAVRREMHVTSAYQPPVIDEATGEVTANPFKAAMETEHLSRGVSSGLLNWLEKDQVEAAANALFGGGCGDIIVSPVFNNQLSTHQASGEYQTVRVSGILQGAACRDSCGFVERTGDFVAENACVHARLHLGQNLHMRLKVDEPVADLRDPAVLRIPVRPGFGYAPSASQIEQVLSGTHLTLIEEVDGNPAAFTVKIYELPEPVVVYQDEDYKELVRDKLSVTRQWLRQVNLTEILYGAQTVCK